MFKTIQSKMIFMQMAMILLVVGGLYVFFANFADTYYFKSKEAEISKAYKSLKKTDISNLENDNYPLVKFEDKKLTFIICDKYFNRIYVTGKKSKPIDAQDMITSKIVKKIDKYSFEYKKENTINKICGYGKIEQNDEMYYVYIYETKVAANVQFSYFKIFYFVSAFFMLVVGVLVALYISNQISKPIKNIEKEARKAVNSGYSINVKEGQRIKEIDSLSDSINTMLAQIRAQMTDLQTEIQQKTDLENQRRQFVNNVSHEMKTPLAIMSGQIEMLQYIKDEDKRKEYCSSLMEEIHNMSNMINDMIVMYSANGESDNLVMEETNVSDIVIDICNRYENLFAKRGIVLCTNIEEQCVSVINERYISQAIDNYVSNALKHSPDDGQVTIDTYVVDGYIHVSVENDGEHLDEIKKEKIWNMFYSGENEDGSNAQKSSGIGLCIVKSVMEIHEGNYGCENTKDGVKFWINIPIK